jgi:diguanylate cyclase (GGDEF)-like protein
MESPRQILVVDDDETVRAMTRTILEAEGHVVRDADSGAHALEELKVARPNLVLLDVMMPNMDGFEVTLAIKHLPGPFVPVILLTALGDQASRARGIESGADEVIGKPVHPVELRLRVRAMLRIQHLAEELHGANRRLERLLRTDDLTHIRNRRGVHSALQREFRRAERYGGPLSILVLDIDRFKGVNDAHGHAVGDDLLVACAQAIRKTLRRVDVVGRTGGDEFVVVAPETPLEDAVHVAERLRVAVAEAAVPIASGPVRITISCGVATLGEVPAENAQTLLRYADLALYRAKALGRDRAAIASALDEVGPIKMSTARPRSP